MLGDEVAERAIDSVNTRNGLPLLALALAAVLVACCVALRAPDVGRGMAAPLPNEDRALAIGRASEPMIPGAKPDLGSSSAAAGRSVSADVSPSPGVSAREKRSSPTMADEDELLRLLDEARREGEPTRRREQLAGICLRWAGFDPAGAVRLALELGLDPTTGALLPNLAQQWAAADDDAAQAWARRLPEGELRDEVYSRIIYERARRDPARATGLLAEMRAGGEARAEAALTVLHFWAERDPGATVAWLAGWPAGEPRDRAVRELRAAGMVAEKARDLGSPDFSSSRFSP